MLYAPGGQRSQHLTLVSVVTPPGRDTNPLQTQL